MPANRPFKPFGVMIGPDGTPIGTVAYGRYTDPNVPVDPDPEPPPVVAKPTLINVTWRSGFASGVIGENTTVGTILADLTSDGVSAVFNDITDLDGKFTVVGSTLRLGAALDYETKTSHSVTIRATNAGGSFDRTISVTVTDYDEVAPTITSGFTLSVAENSAFTHTLTANESVTWAIVGGADSALFSLAGSTLSMTAKDYENPIDAGANNTYVVQVRATDANGNASTQTITVTVTNVNENAAPTQVTPPTMVNLNPVAGEVITSASYNRGGYTGNPATFTYTETVTANGVAKTLPYTVIIGDVLRVQVVVSNGVAPNLTVTSAPTNAAVSSSAPAGSVLASSYNPSTATPYWSGGPWIWLWGYEWGLDSPRRAWSFTSNNVYADFEIRQSDPLFTKPGFSDTNAHRDKIVLKDTAWLPANYRYRYIGKINYRDGIPTTTSFWTQVELHTFGSAFMLAAMFELFDRSGYFGVSANYNPTSSSTATRTLWDASNPGPNGALQIVEGATYDVDIYVKPDPTGSTGRVRVKINDVIYVNFTGKVGFINTTQVAPEFGSYRGPITAAETGIVRHEWSSLTWNATLPDPDPPVGENLGPELAGARQPFTNTTGVFGTNATLAYNASTGGIDVTNTIISADNTFASITITGLTAGKTYKAVMAAKNVTSNNFFLAAESGANFTASADNPSLFRAESQIYITVPVGATSCDVYFHNKSISASRVMNLYSISFKEVLP